MNLRRLSWPGGEPDRVGPLQRSEIWPVRRGNWGVRSEKVRVLGTDRFRPVANDTAIGDSSRPRCGEDALILHRELDLQPLLSRVRVDGAAPVRGTGPIYGAVPSLGFGSGFAID